MFFKKLLLLKVIENLKRGPKRLYGRDVSGLQNLK
jgi:hypothetical protein